MTQNRLFRIFILSIFLTGFSQGLGFADASEAARILGEIPVQHGGRVKPFETFSKEAVMFVTGKAKFEGENPTELIWKWMVRPDQWNEHALIDASYPSAREMFAPAMLVKKRISPEVILNYEPFINEVRRIFEKREKKEKLSLGEQKLADIYEKASLFQSIGKGRTPGWIAHPEEPSVAWLSLQGIISPEGAQILNSFFPEREGVRLMKAVKNTFRGLREGFGSPEATAAAEEFSGAIRALFDSRGIVLNEKVLGFEKTYNRLKPFHWAWFAYAISAFFALFLALASGLRSIGAEAGFANRILAASSWIIFLGGFLIHSYGFYLRCMIAGRPPVSNMYESIIWVSWGVVLFAICLSLFYHNTWIRFYSALVAAMALLIAESFPAYFDPFISPLVPVLRSNLWLTVHVLTITLSYGAFALAWGLGHGAIFNFALNPDKKELNQALTLYLYRTVQIGVVLLAAGTVLGGVWANYSWGRFWGWDPKETWALIALLGYLVVLHGRFSGWMGPFGFAAGCVAAFLGILMAWYGVNYVLAAGLHSYGFGGGGLPYVSAVVGLDLLFILWMTFQYKKKYRKIPVSG